MNFIPNILVSLDSEYQLLDSCLTHPTHPTQPSTGGAVVPSRGMAVAKPSNTGAVSGVANIGIRRAEIKQGTFGNISFVFEIPD